MLNRVQSGKFGEAWVVLASGSGSGGGLADELLELELACCLGGGADELLELELVCCVGGGTSPAAGSGSPRTSAAASSKGTGASNWGVDAVSTSPVFAPED